jgi:asparagine synthase (glutamine-hydrolysing)
MDFVTPVKPNMFGIVDFDNFTTDIEWHPYFNYGSEFTASMSLDNEIYVKSQLHDLLVQAVDKRLASDRKIGFLLSGGLDSSLVVAIATRLLGPELIECFTIGLEGSPDVEASKKVVEYLGIKNHHIVYFTIEDGLKVIPDVIKTIESYDTTTVRASTAQYLMAKYISENTDVKVILSGEGSDEIFNGYFYSRNAPDLASLHQDSVRLIEELYMFDNLRTDRTMAGFGLEVRCPFLDHEFVSFVKRVNPQLLKPSDLVIEKKILRDSFENYLPNEILYRKKAAFSDAVSNAETSWYKSVIKLASETISQSDVTSCVYEINKPMTIDALYYRRIFETYYPGRDNIIEHYWLPKFQEKEVYDPSATVLDGFN